MPQYRVRVDAPAQFDLEHLNRYLNKYATSYLLVRHEPVNPNIHYHIWMETAYADSTIRLMLTNIMPYLKGNGGHSIQQCDPLRTGEYKQYLFNRKQGNRSFFISQVGVDDWEDYQRKSNEATEEFLSTKKSYTKNDCIEDLIAMKSDWSDPNEIFEVVMSFSRKKKTVFSINAIRDVIIAVGYNSGTQACRETVRSSVLKVFLS